MAFASKLPEDKFAKIYDALERRVSMSADAQYQAKLAKAKTEKQRRACVGYYPSEWSKLMGLWCSDKVSNLFVLDCLRVGHVYAPDELNF